MSNTLAALMAQQSASFASRPFDGSKPVQSLTIHSPAAASPFYRNATAATTHATMASAAAAISAADAAVAASAAEPPKVGTLAHAVAIKVTGEPVGAVHPTTNLPYLVHGGPGTVPYDKPPSTAKYSALWEYETYRQLPVPSKEELEKHQPYARYLHPHKYPFLHVDPTPWPLFNAFHMSGLFWGLVLYTHFAQPDLFIMAFIGTAYGWGMWWRDITREALLEGKHTIGVKACIRYAFVLFIASEVLFFMTFFWGYYHNLSNPIWLIMPDDMVIKGWGVPLLNTALLLSSGAAVTWAHHATICAKEIMKKAPK